MPVSADPSAAAAAAPASAASAAAGGRLSTRVRIHAHGGPRRKRWGLDDVAVEEPLELRLETKSIAVVMRTPGHDDELAAGFLLSEAVIRSAADLRAIRPHPRSRAGNVIDVFLSGPGVPDMSRFTRHVFASASCGLCGLSSIRDVRRRFPAVRERYVVPSSVLAGLPDALRRAQSGFTATGGLHAAGLFTAAGTLRVVREDIGRHNAVDKVLGRALLDGEVPLRRSVLVVSGRVSFEIVQKALAAGIAFVASVGAPSSLAVAFARAGGQTLVGFLRDDRFNIYAGRGRVGRLSRGADARGLATPTGRG